MALTSAQISQSTERAMVLAAIKRCEAKMARATDPASRRYYELCLAGWWRHLARLSSVEPTRARG